MSKYDPLLKILEQTDATTVPFTFSEIEKILGFNLPNSARKLDPWWSNDSKSHSQARAWLGAGYKSTDVNLEGETVVFRKQTGPTTSHKNPATKTGQHPMFGCMKGLITIPDNLDLTAPADPDWGKHAYEADA